MKKPLIGISLLLFTSLYINGTNCQAQTKTTTPANKEQQAVDQLRSANSAADDTYFIFNHRYQGIKGTPFLSQYWQKADLRLQSDKVMKDVPIKYDLMENKLIALRKEGDSIILASGLVKEFVLHDMALKPLMEPVDKLYRRYSFLQDSKLVDAYFEVLSEGKEVVLLKRVRKNMMRASQEASYNTGNNADQILSRTEYYVFAANGKAKPVKLSRKGLDKALEEVGVASRAGLTNSVVVSSEKELVSAFQLVAVR
ncbi:hypothetical protein SAMN06265337_1403 [Hymenobacter gelipurpurascens]|uniref:Uncharacterized protein n=1 Tax=Hymenobacter gelipurpurascens TaxID=89968 RepID=A0A212TIM5_9BACT|nr:hypothetical protein [Hymenobacter gelipurpurascens]SNC65825.1 hypothetical protein SAMN06265337_1403 [Hymenobacter gelipurpurascens]